MDNNYDYNDPANILFLPLTESLNSTAGHIASSVGPNCKIVTDEKLEGTQGSLFCPKGETVNFVDLPIDFDTEEDFTVDFYTRFQTGYSGISSTHQYTAGKDGFAIDNNEVFYGVGNKSYVLIAKGNFLVNQWAHYALVRKEGTTYWFVNGVLKATSQGQRAFGSTDFVINARYITALAGGAAHYAFVRISKIARWTEDFEPPVPVAQMAKPKIYIPLAVGDQVALLANTWPLSASLPNFNWASANDSIAAVAQDGVVTAVSPGKTNINVQKEDGSWTAFARIKVLEEPQEADVKLSVLVEVGETRQLLSELEENGQPGLVSWHSRDEAIATVTQTGQVTGISEGLTSITIQDGQAGEVLDSIYVTVLNKV